MLLAEPLRFNIFDLGGRDLTKVGAVLSFSSAELFLPLLEPLFFSSAVPIVFSLCVLARMGTDEKFTGCLGGLITFDFLPLEVLPLEETTPPRTDPLSGFELLASEKEFASLFLTGLGDNCPPKSPFSEATALLFALLAMMDLSKVLESAFWRLFFSTS